MTISVIERNYKLPEDFRERYIGSPCKSWEEARELASAHLCEVEDAAMICMDVTDRGGRCYTATDRETGEILREYFLTPVTIW